MNGKHPVAAPLCMDGEMPMPRRHYVWTGKRPCRTGTMYGRGNALSRLHYVWTGKRPCRTSTIYGRGNAHAMPALCMDGETPMLRRRRHYERETPCRGGTMNGKHPVTAALCMDGETPMPRHYERETPCHGHYERETPCRGGTMNGKHPVVAL